MAIKTFDEVYWLNFNDYEDVRLFEVGCQKCPSAYDYGPIIRDKYILHYVIEGEGTVFLDGKEFQVHEKQAFLLPPNVLSYYKASSTNPWNYIWIQFQGFKASKFLQRAGLTRKNPIFAPEKPCDEVQECMTHILRHPDEECTCIGDMYHLFHLLIHNSNHRSDEDPYQKPTRDYVKIVMDYISEKYSEPLNISTIADYCGLERSYFSKAFKQSTGYTPQEYLIWYRINKAKFLLESTSSSIQRISYSVGYNDSFYFSKLFKNKTGMSPSEWRHSK